MRSKTLGQWFGLLAVLSLLTGVATISSLLLFTLANYADTEKKAIFDLKVKDSIQTKNDLIRLHYFYELSKKWKIQWLADKYLFKDAPFYQVADTYITRDWKKVMRELKDKQDDPRAYLYGDAKFRDIQGKFQEKGVKLEEALEFILKEVSLDFEKTLRNCLDSGISYNGCYDRVWNYDLATNKKDAEEALKNPGQPPKYILGPLKEKEGPPMVPVDKDKGKGDREGVGEGGQGGPRKRP